MLIIGLTGKMKSGKDTVADIIIESFKHKAFAKKVSCADPLKRLCIEFFGLKEHDVYTQEGKESWNHTWGMTNREVLQKIGTDAMRNNFHKDVWAICLKSAVEDEMAIETQAGGDMERVIIVPDVRFNNEAQAILDLGGYIFEVTRPGAEGDDHASEQGINRMLIDTTINNDSTIEDLKVKVTKLVETL